MSQSKSTAEASAGVEAKPAAPAASAPTGFFKNFGAMLLEQWGANEHVARQESRWEPRAAKALMAGAEKGVFGAEEALDWIFSVFPAVQRKHGEGDEEFRLRGGALDPRSLGATLLACAGRQADTSSEADASRDLWTWLRTAPSAAGGAFAGRKGAAPQPLFILAMRHGQEEWAAQWASELPASAWSPNWTPEIIARFADSQSAPKMFSERELTQETAYARRGRTASAKLLEAVLAHELKVFGSPGAVRAERQRCAAVFLSDRSGPDGFLSKLRGIEQLQWVMGAWAENGFLEIESARKWLSDFNAASLGREESGMPALKALSHRARELKSKDAGDLDLGAAEGFWRWLLAQKEWDGTTRSDGGKGMDAAQWAYANGNAALLKRLATEGPAGAINPQWMAWKQMQPQAVMTWEWEKNRGFEQPVDFLWAAVERLALVQATKAAAAPQAPAEALGAEEAGEPATKKRAATRRV